MARGDASRARKSCGFSNKGRSANALVRGRRCRVPSPASSRMGPRRPKRHRSPQQKPAAGDERHDPKREFCPWVCRVSGRSDVGRDRHRLSARLPDPAGALDRDLYPRTDITARIMAQWLSERLGQQFIIENKPGAGNNIGTEAAIHSPPDGYTLLLVNPANAINTTLYPKLPFNFIGDTAPVGGIMRVPNVMEVNPSVPAKTVAEFIAYAKANPGKINWATSGNGTSVHL